MAILVIRGLKLVIQFEEHMVAEAGDNWCFRWVCRCSYEGTYPELDETPFTYSRQVPLGLRRCGFAKSL